MTGTSKLRLVGVQVRPEFVIDDGETLTPVVTQQPLGQYVSAKDWPDYPANGFLEAVENLERELGLA